MSEKLCGLVTVLMGGLALVIEVSFLVVAEGVEVEDVVGTEPVTSGTLAGEQAIAMRAVQVRIIFENFISAPTAILNLGHKGGHFFA